MLVQRRRRWVSIDSTLGAGSWKESQSAPDVQPRLIQCWASVADPFIELQWKIITFNVNLTNVRSITQQTRDIEPLLDQCWANVVDGGPTLIQQWFNVSCLLGTFNCLSYASGTQSTVHTALLRRSINVIAVDLTSQQRRVPSRNLLRALRFINLKSRLLQHQYNTLWPMWYRFWISNRLQGHGVNDNEQKYFHYTVKMTQCDWNWNMEW